MPGLSSAESKRVINKHSSPDSVARKTVNKMPQRKSLRKRFAERMGSRMIGKSSITGKY